MLRATARSTTVAADEPNPDFEEVFQMGYIKPAARVPFFKALEVAMPLMVRPLPAAHLPARARLPCRLALPSGCPSPPGAA